MINGATRCAILCAVVGLAAWATEARSAQSVRLPVSRDTWVSTVGREADGNNGGSSRLKTKSIQEFTLLDFDPRPLRGKVIDGATLHLMPAGRDIQKRVSISSLAAEWMEGRAIRYAVQRGTASFNWAQQDQAPWAWPGSDITAVMMGAGHTRWRFADATAPQRGGYQRVAVDPGVVRLRVAGISHGLVVMDDVGSEYERNGEKFTYHMFPNRFLYSRAAGAGRAPYLVLTVIGEDKQPPLAPTEFAGTTDYDRWPGGYTQANARAMPRGEAIVRWRTPVDRGKAGVVGFHVRVSQDDTFHWDKAAEAPRYLVPLAGKPGEMVRMHLRDLPLDPARPVTIGVKAVDAAGNVGPAATGSVRLSQFEPQALNWDVDASEAGGDRAASAQLGEIAVSVVDPLQKADAVTGAIQPAMPPGMSPNRNHLWDAAQREVTLHTARNEFVAFQIILRGEGRGIRASLDFDDVGKGSPRAKLYRARHVATKTGLKPDPLVPLRGAFAIPASDESNQGQTCQALMTEVYVPREASPGEHVGRLVLRQGGEQLALKVRLNVWRFTLPDHLSFLPEMNCYGLPSPPVKQHYYRLAHEHRTVLNRLCYNWRGKVHDGFKPASRDGAFSFDDWDERFGPMLDGSLFADLPRGPVPVEKFYLPLNENWPMDVHRAFKGGYWVEDAFDEPYWTQLRDATTQFTRHFDAMGWNQTRFEFYLNNKVYFKKQTGGWSGCSAPWIFDEPTHTQDFWALRRYGLEFHRGVAAARNASSDRGEPAQMVFRCDISRPQWQRELLNGVMDVNVVGGAFHRYERMVRERQRRNGELVQVYGAANAVDRSNVQPAAWCVDAWCRGADGVLPWQTIGKERSWREGDALSLFYPGKPAGQIEPVASMRLKAFRRGQQDVEYLVMLAHAWGQPRWAIGRQVLDRLKLRGRFEQQGVDDAGTISYDAVHPVDLWRVRMAVGRALDQAGLPARRQWVELRTPVRDVNALRQQWYVGRE